MYLLRAFFPLFIILFIALPMIGANLGKNHKLGPFIGALIGVISNTLILRFLPWKAYDPIFFLLFVAIGWGLGKQREAEKGVRLGALKGTLIGILSAVVLYFPVDNFNFTIVFVWVGAVALGVILGKQIHIEDGSDGKLGIAIGIFLDVVILIFFIFGFSVY